ncbi:hypothetical protein GOB85_08345 [Acetobacter sp. LMG 1636]|nr:hypothetical protein [Acetobacter fallax]
MRQKMRQPRKQETLPDFEITGKAAHFPGLTGRTEKHLAFVLSRGNDAGSGAVRYSGVRKRGWRFKRHPLFNVDNLLNR